MGLVSQRARCLVAAVSSVVLVAWTTAAFAGPAAMPHVRTANGHVRQLLRDACRRSATFRSIFGKVEQSDLIVYVETTSLPPPHVDAWLQYEGTSPVNRILRVFVRIPASDETIIALLGHELEHATEVAAAPEVRDQRTLEALYRRTGDWSGEGWDSAAARSVTRIVRDELRVRPAVEHAADKR